MEPETNVEEGATTPEAAPTEGEAAAPATEEAAE